MTHDAASPRASLSVLIIGGGIAGLASACALADHHRVTVLERKSTVQETSYAINLKPNASFSAAQFGISIGESHSDNLSGVPCKVVLERSGVDGVVRHEKAVDAEHDFGAPWYFCRRDQLHEELVKVAQSKGVVIQTGEDVVSLTQKIDLPEASPADAPLVTTRTALGNVYSSDVALVADGIHSKLRAHCLPPEAQHREFVRHSGQVAFRALVPWESLRDDEGLDYLARPHHGGLYIWAAPEQRIVAYPCPGAVNIVGIVNVDHLVSAPPASPVPSYEMAEALREQFGCFHRSATALLDKVQQASLWPLLDLDPLPRGGRGNVFIIGDAAHATLPHQGQGASLAFEDAEALSYVLSSVSSAGSAGSGFHKISVTRKDRVRQIQHASRVMAQPADYASGEKLDALKFSSFILKYKGFASLLEKTVV